jgi:hypothetical protein
MAEFVGRKIMGVRSMTEAEGRWFGWEPVECERTPVLLLDNGSVLFPGRDPEGNGPGVIFGRDRGEVNPWRVDFPRVEEGRRGKR